MQRRVNEKVSLVSESTDANGAVMRTWPAAFGAQTPAAHSFVQGQLPEPLLSRCFMVAILLVCDFTKLLSKK